MLRWVGLGATAALLAAVPAVARDSGPKADFAGLFVGVQTQYGFGAQGDWSYAAPIAGAANGEGGVGAGVQAGYGWRAGAFVLEGQLRASYADLAFDNVCAPTVRCNGQLDWLAEAQAGVGIVVFGDIMLMASAGLAAGDVEAAAGGRLKETATHDGHVLALRGDWGMSGGWRYGVEYRYYDMAGTNRLDTPTTAPTDIDVAWTVHAIGLTIANEF
jgi:hypothetical protein